MKAKSYDSNITPPGFFIKNRGAGKLILDPAVLNSLSIKTSYFSCFLELLFIDILYYRKDIIAIKHYTKRTVC